MKLELKNIIRNPLFIVSALLVGGSTLAQSHLSREDVIKERIYNEYMRVLSYESVATPAILNTIHGLARHYGYTAVLDALEAKGSKVSKENLDRMYKKLETQGRKGK